MGKKLKEVDAYIAKSAEFARPMLTRIRAAFHKACPDIEETIKWGMPHFERKGIVANMAAFKAHVWFRFWKSGLLRERIQELQNSGKASVNFLRMTSVSELPPDKGLVALIKEAVRLNEDGVKPVAKRPKAARRKPVAIPDSFMTALKRNKKALRVYEKFSPSAKKEYVEWIAEAKQEATRDRRIATAIEWISEGKQRNWKYMKERK